MLKKILQIDVRIKRVAAIIIGALAGYSYYYFIGCYSGTCLITGNPWISTIYGAVIGALAAPWKRKQTQQETK